ncbi:MAG TPA: hypothetical protein VGY76_10565 [Solirubrobacteraceae bacterium]|jgi:hypothetical protein|nr:hypothetical protein [Solirubrobacteraceae bacterium]
MFASQKIKQYGTRLACWVLALGGRFAPSQRRRENSAGGDLADRLEGLAREVSYRTNGAEDWITTLALQLSELGRDARENYERLLPAEGDIPTAAQGVALARFLRWRLRESGSYATVTRGDLGLPDTYLHIQFPDGYEGGIDREGRLST